jgi:hypothetical protein
VDLTSMFAALPGATPFEGLADAWQSIAGPGFGTGVALSRDGERVLRCYARLSYDEDLVRAVLAFAREHGGELAPTEERPLVVAEGFAPPGSLFDTVVAVGPAVHRNFADDPRLHDHSLAVFPAYRCEFSGSEDREQAQYQYARAAGVPVSRLDRIPHPYLRMRYKTETGREIPELGLIGVSMLATQLRRLEGDTDRFIEFENYRLQLWRVEWDGAFGVTALAGSDEPDEPGRRELGLDEMLDFARATLYGPNLAAGDAEFSNAPA